eukprot:jgi/Mesen1/8215/ME000442S07500
MGNDGENANKRRREGEILEEAGEAHLMQVDEKKVDIFRKPVITLPTFSTDLLRSYYKRSVPGSDPGFFKRREFSYTLHNDIFVRYQTFNDEAELAAGICDKCPLKIDIGAVFNVDPAKRAAYQSSGSERAFAPVERELVFDVDMTDYDDIRTCCSGANVCERCWPLMTIAIKVIDRALRDDFGFEHLLWVFSGRRGVHCWVCDDRARRLTNEQRSSVADYFRVYKGGENNKGKVSLPGLLHPALGRAYEEVLKAFFEDHIAPNQGLLASPEACERMLLLIPDEDVREKMEDKWRSDRRMPDGETTSIRWKQLETAVRASLKKREAAQKSGLRRCLEEIVFTYTYPRLDADVSKHMNHLLKAPFCVHPKTELRESESSGGVLKDGERAMDRTSLGAAVRLFRSSFLEPLQQSNKARLAAIHKQSLQDQQGVPSYAW